MKANAQTQTPELLVEPGALREAFEQLVSWADELHLAYAWGSGGGPRSTHWQALRENIQKVERALIGIHFAQTDPELLAELHQQTQALRVITDTSGVFHPKVVVGVRKGEARAILGSSNLTRGGFEGNTELNVLISGAVDKPPLSKALAFIQDHWNGPRAVEMTEEWLAEYRDSYAGRPSPPPVSPPSLEAFQVGSVADVDVDWGRYYQLVVAQENRTLAANYEVHVFEHEDGSYLQEAEWCRSAFEKCADYQAMDLDDRKLVSGWGERTTGFFGHMGGAGYFKSMVLEEPEEIGRPLNKIPLDGPVTNELAREYLEQVTALRGIGLAVASRLLCVKRPDRFLTLNNANDNRIREIFGSFPTTVKTYLELHERIWDMPWFNSAEPADLNQLRVWKARVGLLDALLYEVE